MANKIKRRVDLDRQIEFYEDCISRLEERRRAGIGDGSRLEIELEQAYKQSALLKIRRMMNM